MMTGRATMTTTGTQPMYCTCEGNTGGWTNRGAGTDQEWWVHPACQRPSRLWLEGTDAAMLNFFKGGPMDGSAYETKALMTTEALALPVAEYAWTPEVVTSAITGASARVWVHRSLGQGTEAATVNANAAVHDNGEGGSDTEDDVAGGHIMATKKTVSLLDRRLELKLSRQQVADKSGVSNAQVSRIEKMGPRTTEEEIAKVSAGLDALEAELAADPA